MCRRREGSSRDYHIDFGETFGTSRAAIRSGVHDAKIDASHLRYDVRGRFGSCISHQQQTSNSSLLCTPQTLAARKDSLSSNDLQDRVEDIGKVAYTIPGAQNTIATGYCNRGHGRDGVELHRALGEPNGGQDRNDDGDGCVEDTDYYYDERCGDELSNVCNTANLISTYTAAIGSTSPMDGSNRREMKLWIISQISQRRTWIFSILTDGIPFLIQAFDSKESVAMKVRLFATKSESERYGQSVLRTVLAIHYAREMDDRDKLFRWRCGTTDCGNM